MALLIRSAIADYINIGTKTNKVWALCGTGFNSLDESPNAQVDSKVYIHEDEATPSITRYESSFGFDIDTWNEQEAIMAIYDIARNRKIGTNALVEYLRTDFKVEEDGTPITTIVPARMFTCAVEVSDIQGGGGETLTMSGNLNVVGEFLDGTFDLENRVFEEGAEVPKKQLKQLTVTLKPGQLKEAIKSVPTRGGDGDDENEGLMQFYKVNVTPDIMPNNKYVYMTREYFDVEHAFDGETPFMEYNDCLIGNSAWGNYWNFWNGKDELYVAEQDWLLIAEVSDLNFAKGFGAVCNGEPREISIPI